MRSEATLFDSPEIKKFIADSLAEDIGAGDHSSLACIPADKRGNARILMKQDGVLAGMQLARRILETLDPQARLEIYAEDGARVKAGETLALAEGSVHALLAGERLLLNCMQRLSGIATVTAAAVDLVSDLPVRLLDTRKTTPGLRRLEKWAVKTGGGYNHRFGLFDMIMLKDNHIDFAGGIEAAIERTLDYLASNRLSLGIEVETRNLNDVHRVLRYPEVQRIMFDNFSPELVAEGVQMVGGSMETEASGGIHMQNLRAYGETGVDFISLGLLTHSAKSLDISMKTVILG
jgi:nicotinate-nucleotide pyrophosphorylase (carboxylating)